MTYAEELILEGEQRGRQAGLREGERGRLEERVRTIEGLMRAGVQWPVIESATGIDREALSALKRRLEEAERSRSLSISLDESDALDVPVNDLMETENKYRTQGPSAFKTHEQLKRELFGD